MGDLSYEKLYLCGYAVDEEENTKADEIEEHAAGDVVVALGVDTDLQGGQAGY